MEDELNTARDRQSDLATELQNARERIAEYKRRLGEETVFEPGPFEGEVD